MGRTLKSLYRERRTMKNIALLSLLTLAILQPLAEAQRGVPGVPKTRFTGDLLENLRAKGDGGQIGPKLGTSSSNTDLTCAECPGTGECCPGMCMEYWINKYACI